VDATDWERAVGEDARDALAALLVPGAITCVVQPIVRVTDGAIVAYEALARMGPGRPAPDRCLELAESVGLRLELELACLVAASRCGAPPGDALLCVNASPALLQHPLALSVREELPAHLVVELTEQAAVDDYDSLRGAIASWKSSGVLIAVDDMGSGWASLRHVIQLQPDFIKIDRSLISEVDRSAGKRALVAAMVAFGRESGCSIIAEGVERGEELATLRDADVTLVQGYLLARPGPPWPGAADPTGRASDRRAGRPRGRATLEDRLDAATDAREACAAVADHLWQLGGLMPSAYLVRDGVLRCLAQRGLWQVLDGMPPGVGITGQVFATATTRLVPDVRDSPDYLEAIPGVVAELCVPVLVHGAAAGSINVESFTRLSEAAIAEVHRGAARLGRRLEVIGVDSGGSAYQRLVRHVAAMVEATERDELVDAVVAAAIDVSGLDSAALVLRDWTGSDRVVAARGPLAVVLAEMGRDELAHLGQLVARVASCYTAGETTGAGLAATEGVRAAGGRTMVVVPLATRGRRLGHLVVAGTVPATLRTEDAERIELLGAHAAACLDNLASLDPARADLTSTRT
jgi:EAL domain-containing protein (putative c-di-GMP-specific phosphodiesterase class I)/putative methionine-R-sulfoxide reductase with GAF domain